MDNDRIDAHVFHQDDVQHELLLEGLFHHGVAAVLYDNGLVGKLSNIGEGLNKNPGP